MVFHGLTNDTQIVKTKLIDKLAICPIGSDLSLLYGGCCWSQIYMSSKEGKKLSWSGTDLKLAVPNIQ